MTKQPYLDPDQIRSISVMATAAPEIPVLARDRAFESLYRSYVKDVYHYALALLRNPADAEDVTQTTFMNAYRAYKSGLEIEKPQNWLIKIAHNVARTRYARAGRRVREVPLEDHVEQLALPEEEKPNVAAVLHALGRLPFNQRAAIVMRELEGRTYAEISDTLGVSVAAVETLIFRGRRSLRLRASALRSLGAVPLPASLAQLFEGGGAVAGGVGTAFLTKAALALVAGAMATGIGGGNGGPAAAAARPAQLAAGPAVGNGAAVSRLRALSVTGVKLAVEQGVRQGPATAARGSRLAAKLVADKEDLRAAPLPETTTRGSSARAATTGEQLAASVTGVKSTVEQTAATATLPVEAPSLASVQASPLPAVSLP
jgi:RNA polymerase sigma factor (sigma-70 family)